MQKSKLGTSLTPHGGGGVQKSKLGTSLTPHGGKGGVQKSKSPHLRAEPGGCKKKRHHTLETEGPLVPRVQGSKKFASWHALVTRGVASRKFTKL